MTTYRACLLCGYQGGQPIEHVVVRWIEPQAGRIFDALPRCVDRAACRARVEASGERWEVADGTPGAAPSQAEAHTRATLPDQPVVPAQPVEAREAGDLAEAFG